MLNDRPGSHGRRLEGEKTSYTLTQTRRLFLFLYKSSHKNRQAFFVRRTFFFFRASYVNEWRNTLLPAIRNDVISRHPCMVGEEEKTTEMRRRGMTATFRSLMMRNARDRLCLCCCCARAFQIIPERNEKRFVLFPR